jgi:putative endonuclease
MPRWLTRLVQFFRPPAWSENRDPLGPAGERAAEKFLKARGYRILARNARVPMGEADLLCEAADRSTIVLVEVKSRRLDSGRIDPPAEAAVTRDKRRKLVKILKHLARANRWHARPLRIDIIGVDFRNNQPVEIRHHTGAVGI